MLATNTQEAVEFTVPGEAVPWARAGGGRTMHRFTPKKQQKYMALVRETCAKAMAGRALLLGAVELSIVAVYVVPQSWSKKRRADATWKPSAPDADNLSKIIKDALNPRPKKNLEPVVWRDDAQVSSLHVWKKYGDRPRVVVRIRSLEGVDA